MKLFQLLMPLVVCLGLSSCATSSHYDAKVETWKGQSTDLLVQAWGQPDSIESLHTGNKMYVYARLRHDPISFTDFQNKTASNTTPQKTPRKPASGSDTGIYIRCATYFEVTRQNIVDSVMFRGDECR